MQNQSLINQSRIVGYAVLFCGLLCTTPVHATSAPAHVDITWMSVTNMYFEVGKQLIIADGYFTRVPEANFYGTTYQHTHVPTQSDVAAVKEVMNALGGKQAVNLLLTGHSHFDHSFDTGTWSALTGARVIGALTTCLQTQAEGIPKSRCTAVYGGEKIELGNGLTMYVIRWNHSGNSTENPDQHNPLELSEPPHPDPISGALRAGLIEDFPNGGGVRAYLFVVNNKAGRFSWLFTDSAGFADINEPIVLNGVNYGAPLENLRATLKVAGLDSVDLWLGTGGIQVAEKVLPVAKPKAYMPIHWDGLFGAFHNGVPYQWFDPALESRLASDGIKLIKPLQYMDKWRLDQQGIQPIDNHKIKKSLGFGN